MSSVRSIYVSAGVAEDAVRNAVEAWLDSAGRTIEVNVEFGDEYAGFETAVDVYAADDEKALADARSLAQGLSRLLPSSRVALDVDLESSIKRATA